MENPLKDLEAKAGKQPWYIWAGALAGGGVVFWFVLRSRANAASTASTTASTANGDPNGLTSSSNIAGLPYDTSGYTSGNGPTDNYPSSGFPEVTSGNTTVPYLPPGVNPIYDASGNLVGYQPAPATPTPTTPAPTPAPKPDHAPTNGLLGAKVGVRNNKGVWQYLTPGSKTWKSVPLPSGTTFSPGSDGRWWYVLPGTGIQFLLTSGTGSPVTNSGYPVNSPGINQPAAKGSGGPSEWQHGLNSTTRNTVDQHAALFSLLG